MSNREPALPAAKPGRTTFNSLKASLPLNQENNSPPTHPSDCSNVQEDIVEEETNQVESLHSSRLCENPAASSLKPLLNIPTISQGLPKPYTTC